MLSATSFTDLGKHEGANVGMAVPLAVEHVTDSPAPMAMEVSRGHDTPMAARLVDDEWHTNIKRGIQAMTKLSGKKPIDHLQKYLSLMLLKRHFCS